MTVPHSDSDHTLPDSPRKPEHLSSTGLHVVPPTPPAPTEHSSRGNIAYESTDDVLEALHPSRVARYGSTSDYASPAQPITHVTSMVMLEGGFSPLAQGDSVEPLPTNRITIPGYHLLGLLGRGGMGRVYHAVQQPINRPVALKMVDQRAQTIDLVRFLAEAEAIAAIDHPSVVRIYEFGEAQGQPYLAMEYLPGGSLADRLQREGPIPSRVAGIILEKLARGIQAAHDAGIVHRDLKPANVLFDGHGQPKIVDFGLAKIDGGSNLTQAEDVLGTPVYMSPEQARGGTQSVGPAADVYALGVILYEMLCGKPPFEHADVWKLLSKVQFDDPPSLRQKVPGISLDLERIVSTCLAKIPSERFASAGELADELQRWLNDEPLKIRPPGIFERINKWVRRKPTIAIAYILSVTVTGLLIFAVSAIQSLAREEEARQQLSDLQQATETARHNEELARKQAEADRDAAARARDEAIAARQAEQAAVGRLLRMDAHHTVELAYRQTLVPAVASAERLLETCPPEFRGWEWELVQSLCDQSAWKSNLQADSLGAFAIDPRNDHLWAIDTRGTLRSIHPQSGIPLVNVPLGILDAQCMTVLSHNQMIIVGTRAGDVFLIPAENRRPIHLGKHDGPVTDVAMLTTDQIVTTSEDQTIRVWSLATRNVLTTLERQSSAVRCVATAPRMDYFLTGGHDRRLRFWSTQTWQLQHTTEPLAGPITDIELSPDARTAFIVTQDGPIYQMLLFPTPEMSRPPFPIIPTPPARILSICMPAGIGTLLTSSNDQAVRIWPIPDNQKGHTLLTGHRSSVLKVLTTLRGDRAFSLTSQGEIFAWDLHQRPHQRRHFTGTRGRITQIAYHPKMTQLAMGDSSGSLRIIPLVGMNPPIEIIQAKEIRSMVYSPDGARLAVSTVHGHIAIVDTQTGRVQSQIVDANPIPNQLIFSPDGSELMGTLQTTDIQVWSTLTGKPLPPIQTQIPGIRSLVVSPDGTAFLVGTARGQILRLDRATRQTVEIAQFTGRITNILLTPNGESLLVTTDRVQDGLVQIRLANHAIQQRMVLSNPVEYLHCRNDNRTLVTSGSERFLRFWDLQQGVATLSIDLPRTGARPVQFSPDGKRLATQMDLNTLLEWHPGERIHRPSRGSR
ncbi:WD40 repeat domain-containing serine/threonine protein kinase [Tuwongella immobilis]|uniref:Protein kinase domain-containing protein n=1 Tax=Tuwongella immobilis TaxID=692036 RepID=A0A6C2YI91_9BACT|nr:WD40 repeat domain-containing serine/threonine protein kinase [Tuwongella immobilis]VIP00712.1 wd40 repeat-containing protein : WD40 repeat-containing protein OS=Singulisphaera acidiphila (strain ATCC BAA-1392 / DSM 18658 / VKM B-2454 / MOB10) GN=Sinac_7396 PE=3 SV=1: Pkinase: WD40: WD40 [Tuwongella immobilis]VTR96842.1 wd40 repeat-containing protein : WD40 repeat-containing protein OS=Singulisphaera acidiphila (strain ATCC BAA-1392 / DSM 18658 / VKM B-2454 / MOB10) GN=Sinac_7396 PE=3 SV=1: Pk